MRASAATATTKNTGENPLSFCSSSVPASEATSSAATVVEGAAGASVVGGAGWVVVVVVGGGRWVTSAVASGVTAVNRTV